MNWNIALEEEREEEWGGGRGEEMSHTETRANTKQLLNEEIYNNYYSKYREILSEKYGRVSQFR